MFRLAELFVQITGDAKPIQGALNLLKGQLLGMAPLGGRLGAALAEGIAGPLLGISATAAGAIGAGIVAGIALTGALVKAATLASDLQETVAKTEQVFGSSTGKVTAAADEMASKFGIVKTEFLDAASMFGLIAQGAGVAGDKAADMSISLAKLAADASSFYNNRVDIALEKIRAGLVGEAEPLRAFGVQLTEDAVKAKALAMGLTAPGKELTNQAKIMARYQLIQEGLAKALGDLERTGGGAANQWRKLTGQLTNMASTVGEVVLPAFTLGLQWINYFVTGIAGHITGLKGVWDSFLEYLGVGADKAAKLRELTEIDARNAKMVEQTQAEERRAQLAKASGDQNKGFQGGLVEFAHKVQEGAWGGKNQLQNLGDTAKQQLEVLKQGFAGLLKKDTGPMAAVAM
jgi:hypothetical protein